MIRDNIGEDEAIGHVRARARAGCDSLLERLRNERGCRTVACARERTYDEHPLNQAPDIDLNLAHAVALMDSVDLVWPDRTRRRKARAR
jgi:hypothetical protein